MRPELSSRKPVGFDAWSERTLGHRVWRFLLLMLTGAEASAQSVLSPTHCLLNVDVDYQAEVLRATARIQALPGQSDPRHARRAARARIASRGPASVRGPCAGLRPDGNALHSGSDRPVVYHPARRRPCVSHTWRPLGSTRNLVEVIRKTATRDLLPRR